MRRTGTIEASWSRASSVDKMTRELIDAEEGCRYRDNSSSSSSCSRSSVDIDCDWGEKPSYASDATCTFESLVNFGVVAPGLYRSGYPSSQHFAYMNNLRLKTIVTLVANDEPDEALENFVSGANIKHFFFAIKGTKKEAIPDATMSSILDVVLDQRNYPLLVHCNKGKHRTGCVVAAVRKAHGWHSSKALAEYRSFAEPKVRETDVEYIANFDHVAMGIIVPPPASGGQVLGGHSYQAESSTQLSYLLSSLSTWRWGQPASAMQHSKAGQLSHPSTPLRPQQESPWFIIILSVASIGALVLWFLYAW